jgi:hypothetical protein
VVTEISPNIGLPSRSVYGVTEKEDAFSYVASAPGDEGNGDDDNARGKILANFRVLARTNLILKRVAGSQAT